MTEPPTPSGRAAGGEAGDGPPGGGHSRRLWAVRGAVQASTNEARPILDATDDLMRALLERNSLEPADLVSCVFTMTADLDAEFPAVAAREVGLDAVPLLCAREIPVPDAMPRVIRALMHYYAPGGHEPEHVYLGATRALRSDLHSAQ
jgi:chorismate mutase